MSKAKQQPEQLSFGLIVTDPQAHRQRQQMKERRCLSCSSDFLSAGPGNRICMRCKDLDAWNSPAASYAVAGAF